MSVNECFSSYNSFHIHHNARLPFRILNAKFLLSSLHVHDSFFKMLAKKIFLSAKLIKLKQRFQTTKVNSSVYNCNLLSFQRSTIYRSIFFTPKKLEEFTCHASAYPESSILGGDTAEYMIQGNICRPFVSSFQGSSPIGLKKLETMLTIHIASQPASQRSCILWLNTA